MNQRNSTQPTTVVTADTAGPTERTIIELTTSVVAAYIGHNQMPRDGLPEFIRNVHGALTALAGGNAPEVKGSGVTTPAVAVKKSITDEYIVCLEDGKRLKMLKRYLRSHYDMSPEDYRRKWNLPTDYPMVAPNYAKQRSDFAKSIGLGRPSGAAPQARGRKPKIK